MKHETPLISKRGTKIQGYTTLDSWLQECVMWLNTT